MMFDKKTEEDTASWFGNVDKGQLLLSTRAFSASPLNTRQCRAILSRLLYLVAVQADPNPATKLTHTEATDLFFATTKLFQSRDVCSFPPPHVCVCVFFFSQNPPFKTDSS